MNRWKPPKDADSLNEYDLHCDEKEEMAEKEIVKISENVQPFDCHESVQHPFEKLAEESVLVEQRSAEEEEEKVDENEEKGKDNLGLED